MTQHRSLHYRPLTVRADLAAGLAHAAPWGTALDGLLAAELWARHKSGRPTGTYPSALDVDDPPDLDLPLARCIPTDGPWHWSATCAYPLPRPNRLDIHTWTGRADHRHLEHLTHQLPGTLPTRQGRYRSRVMPLLVTPCQAVTWHAVGDPEEIADLLTGIAAIGKKRGHGEGQVLYWTVTQTPSLDAFTAGHLNPDGTLSRPTPAGCLPAASPPLDGGRGRAGVRPPYMHRSRQHELRLPAPLDR